MSDGGGGGDGGGGCGGGDGGYSGGDGGYSGVGSGGDDVFGHAGDNILGGGDDQFVNSSSGFVAGAAASGQHYSSGRRGNKVFLVMVPGRGRRRKESAPPSGRGTDACQCFGLLGLVLLIALIGVILYLAIRFS